MNPRSRFHSFVALLLICSVMLSGCMSIKNELPDAASAPKISFGPIDEKGERDVIRTFSVTGRATYWFLYLIPKNKLDGYELARREIKDGEAIQNLKVTTKYDIVDFFVGFVALVFGTYRIDVEGQVVKA